MAHDAILIIDDHALFRSGIVAVLAAAFADVPVRDAASLDEALAADAPGTEGRAPSVILLDLRLPGRGGLDGMGLLRRRWPSARIVVVSAQDRPETVETALALGAVAFLSKVERPERMIAVLRGLLGPPAGSPAPCPSLTPRQADVLALLARGLSNKAIGRRLGLSEHTVRGHVQGVLGVLGVARRAEATFRARQLGLVR